MSLLAEALAGLNEIAVKRITNPIASLLAQRVKTNAPLVMDEVKRMPSEMAALVSPQMNQQVQQAMSNPAPGFDKEKGMQMAMDFLQTSTPVGGLLAHTVYHGSPHKFNKFDMSKIGTGEGKQAYGHGLYFAEAPEVARSYQKSTSYQDAVRQFRAELPDDADFTELVNLARSGKMSPQNARVVNALDADDWLGYDYPSQAITGAFKHGKSHDMSPELQAAINEYGNLYKVDIPDESIPRMLDWDKPLSEQSQYVRDAIDKSEWGIRDMAYMITNNPDPIGADLLKFMGKGDAEKHLRGLGIPGIKYLDGNSRGVGGTSNFVLFDDQLPRILEVNGQPTGLLSYADEAKKVKKK